MEKPAMPAAPLVIVDLEATCWPREDGLDEEMETIEIGAVLIDPDEEQVVAEFDAFVRPIRHPILSDFCRELTTITQEDVDNADRFPAVLERFVEWTGNAQGCILASWGRYDPQQLRKDCYLHGIDYPFLGPHMNVKNWFAQRVTGKRRCGLKRAVRLCNLDFAGTHHRGIDDARNIWRVIQTCMQTRIADEIIYWLAQTGGVV
jgi:inhibitor of KinA sporulation pathway (predicted exonuclease)